MIYDCQHQRPSPATKKRKNAKGKGRRKKKRRQSQTPGNQRVCLEKPAGARTKKTTQKKHEKTRAGQGRQGIEKKIAGKAKHLRFKGFGPECGEGPGGKKDHAERGKKGNPKRPKSFWVYFGSCLRQLLALWTSPQTPRHAPSKAEQGALPRSSGMKHKEVARAVARRPPAREGAPQTRVSGRQSKRATGSEAAWRRAAQRRAAPS